MKSIHWVSLAIAFGSAACAVSSLETTPLNSPPHPLAARAPSSVEVFSSTPPTRPHVDVALITANQSNLDGDTSGAVAALLQQAAKLGCDALYISNATSRAGNPDVFDPGTRGLLGTCIAYTGAAPAPGEAPLAAPNAVVVMPPALSPAKPVVIVDKISTGEAH